MNTNAANTVRVQSDTSTLLQALRATFTDHTKVLGELLQNGRRAKATRIEITVTDQSIGFRDDGVGIDDPSVLLSIAKSGWDDETMSGEAPYGLGWVSCLFSCETVSVLSKGKHLIAQTDDLIALKPIAVNESADTGYTEVVLINHRLGTEQAVISRLTGLVKGFPIPVTVNGEELPRPLALVGDGWLEGEVCWVRRSDAMRLGNDVSFFLQGLPINLYQSYGGWGCLSKAIHLKSPQVKGRLPERDTVLEPEVVNEAVRKDRREIACRVASEMAAAGQYDALLELTETLAELELLDLLDGANRVPDCMIESFKAAPYQTQDWNRETYLEAVTGMTLDDLRAVGTIYVTEGDFNDDMLAKHFVHARKGMIVTEHSYVSWLSKFVLVEEIDGDDITVTGADERSSDSLEELWNVGRVAFVEKITLSHPTLGEVEMEPQSAVFDGDTLFVTEGVNAEHAVCQADDFVDEDGGDDEDRRTAATNELYLQLMEVFGSASPAELFKQVLVDAYLPLPDRVKGQTFTVTIDALGHLTVA